MLLIQLAVTWTSHFLQLEKENNVPFYIYSYFHKKTQREFW
jgi:hypothetical protein